MSCLESWFVKNNGGSDQAKKRNERTKQIQKKGGGEAYHTNLLIFNFFNNRQGIRPGFENDCFILIA